MAKETTRKARIEHKCDACEGIIAIGEMYIHGKQQHPRYAQNENDPTEDGEQIGVVTHEWRVHLYFNTCWMSEDCKNDKHKWEFFDTDVIETPCYLCTECNAGITAENYKLNYPNG